VTSDTPDITESIEQAVARGIKAALSDPETVQAFWTGAVQTFNDEAKKRTGEFVIGSISALVRKGLLFMALGYFVYSVGGWTALAAFWRAATGH
jgi:hypothetical protein